MTVHLKQSVMLKVVGGLQRLLPGLWAGLLLTVALVATPAPFATLATADAGRVVAQVLAREAQASLVFAAVLLLLAQTLARRGAHADATVRGILDLDLWLLLAALVCTVVGYHVVQPLMVAARAGQGGLSFAQLHVVSAVCFVVKTALVLTLAWRVQRPQAPAAAMSALSRSASS